jgi:PST family polysaccharide transporter
MHTIKCSADVFINNIAPNLYNSFSVVLLGFVGGSASNGIFDAGTKFSNIIRQFLTTISRVFFPFLSRKIGGHNLYLRINLIVSCVSVVFLLLFAPAIIKLFFVEEFYDAILILQISSVSLIFLALSDAYGLNYLIINGHTKRLRNITLCISVFGFFLAFPMIMKFDHVGAALTITLVRILLGSTITIAAIRLKSQLAEGV